jgi:hypothetical protein
MRIDMQLVYEEVRHWDWTTWGAHYSQSVPSHYRLGSLYFPAPPRPSCRLLLWRERTEGFR